MIKKIVKYKSEDGLEFDTEYEAIKHERFNDVVIELDAMLGTLPKNWEHLFKHIQRDKHIVDVVKNRVFKLVKMKYTDELGYISNCFGEPKYLLFRNLLTRLALIDSNGIEYSNFYIRNNPKQSKGEYKK